MLEKRHVQGEGKGVCANGYRERPAPQNPHRDITRTVESRAVMTEEEGAHAFLGSF